MLVQVYGREAVSRKCVYEWFKRFREGKETIEDEPRSGRPSTSRTPEMIEKVRQMLAQDRRLSLGLIAEELDISKDTIVRDDLGKRKICSRLVPHKLTDEQKAKRMETSGDFISMCDQDPLLLKTIVTGHETWYYQFDPESKRQSMSWCSPTSPRPKKPSAKIQAIHAESFQEIRGLNQQALIDAVPVGNETEEVDCRAVQDTVRRELHGLRASRASHARPSKPVMSKQAHFFDLDVVRGQQALSMERGRVVLRHSDVPFRRAVRRLSLSEGAISLNERRLCRPDLDYQRLSKVHRRQWIYIALIMNEWMMMMIDDEGKYLVHDPFHCDIENNKLSLSERDQLIELSNDTGLKMKFQAEYIVNFWISSHVNREYSELYNGALQIIIQFALAYLCEKGFSQLTLIKTKYRNRLDVCDDLRFKLASIHPNIEHLCKNRQAHPSH
ncbi:hypothetical protein ANN_14245 [Periplaneta americana]|uniref:Transposase n=1 Tax=Periplaneta americana TaxID=6978 RepID=A0ABQ8SX05_PERAM|nr:hypothetical protein ANN_14245 [Periplaneta americana]